MDVQRKPVEYTIRRSEVGDYMAMRDVNRIAWERAYNHIYTDDEIHGLFEDKLSQHGTWVERRLERIATLVAETPGGIIGFCGVSILKGGDGEIVTLYIHPDYQNIGVGTALWNAGLDLLREAGCNTAWVWVLAKARAVAFYEHKGCVLTEKGTYTVGDHAETTHGYTLELLPTDDDTEDTD